MVLFLSHSFNLQIHTGQGALWSTKSLTLPIKVRLNLLRPRDPITIRPAFSDLAELTITSPGFPLAVRIFPVICVDQTKSLCRALTFYF